MDIVVFSCFLLSLANLVLLIGACKALFAVMQKLDSYQAGPPRITRQQRVLKMDEGSASYADDLLRAVPSSDLRLIHTDEEDIKRLPRMR